MNKWLLIILLGWVHQSCATELAVQKGKKQEVTFEQFRKDLEQYVVEPGWVVTDLLALPLPEFQKAWDLFLTTLCDTPWKLFGAKQAHYSERASREILITHCLTYQTFLMNVLVDVTHNRLILATGLEKSALLKQPGIITLMQYWQAKRDATYQRFFAFYFDRVAACYIEAVVKGYSAHDTAEYPALYKESKTYLSLLNGIFKHLKGGSYDARYAFHLKRYREVLYLLQQERAQYQGEYA